MKIIIAQPQDWSVVASPDSGSVKMELLAKLQAIHSVANADEQAEAVRCCQEVKRSLSDVEKLRNELKRPIIDLGKRVDKLASDFSDVLELDIKRITAMITAYQTAESARAKAAEEARQAEITRAHAAEELARQRLLDVQAAVATGSTVDDGGLAESLKVAAEIDVEETGAAADLAIRSLEVVPTKTSGLAMKTDWLYRINDPVAVYKIHPEFFELTEKKRVINSAIGEGFVCDGMEVWSELKPIIRK